MALRRLASAVPSRVVCDRTDADGDRVEREREWLARQHERFAREWGRGWLWRKRAGSGGAARGDGAEEACLLAALRLECERTGRWRLPDREPAADLLLPPTLIREMGDVAVCLAVLLRARDHLPERLVFDAATLLAELGQNVCRHSGEIGCAAVTWSAAAGELCLAVVDQGVGMAGGLRRRSEKGARGGGGENTGTAGSCLRSLLAPGGTIEPDRGMGLRLSRALVARHHGTLHLRSGGLIVTIGPGEEGFWARCPRRLAAVPGTQICVRLRSPPADAGLTRRVESR